MAWGNSAGNWPKTTLQTPKSHLMGSSTLVDMTTRSLIQIQQQRIQQMED